MNAEFLAMLYTCPPAASDAIVVLCGEDGMPRYRTAFHAFKMGLAPVIVLSGGKHDDSHIDAKHAELALIGSPYGVSPDKLITESASQNTHEQAVNVIEMAQDKGWTKLLLIASAYHLPRAFLTFIHTLAIEGANLIRVVPVAAASTSWQCPPDGLELSRERLFQGEDDKIAQYQQAGHVASYASGIAYLKRWEPHYDTH
jgi:hypothetical protein